MIDAHALLAAVCLKPTKHYPAISDVETAVSNERRRSKGMFGVSKPTPRRHIGSNRLLNGIKPEPPNEINRAADVGGLLYPPDQEGSPPAYEDILNLPNETAPQGSAVEAEVATTQAPVAPAPTPTPTPAPTSSADVDMVERNSVDHDNNHDHGDRNDDDNSVDARGGGGNSRPEDIAAASTVEEENARLRSELEVFDLGFFEEVEDLKYSYVALKREAEKLAKRQGVDLSASLDLPEAGEEPWDRSVDMAHHSVDWAGTHKERTSEGSPCSPPRGAHAARLYRAWNRLSSAAEQAAEGFPLDSFPRGSERILPGARSVPNAGGGDPLRPYSGGSNHEPSLVVDPPPPPRGNGLIAAHERKLAWELSSGGMASLACLREHAGRVDRAGGGFGSNEEVLSALRGSGYAELELEDVAVLRTGLGSNAEGKMDMKEFMGMCEDIASDQEWYVPHSAASTAAAVAAKVLSPMVIGSPEPRFFGIDENVRGGSQPARAFLKEGEGQRQENGGGAGGADGGLNAWAHQLRDVAHSRVAGSEKVFSPNLGDHELGIEPLYLGGTQFGERSFLEASKNAADVLAEVKDQLSLLDMSRLFPPSDRDAKTSDSSSRNRTGPKVGAAAVGGRTMTLGQAVGMKFSRRDPTQSGLLSAREVGLALEDVGVLLQPGEVITLAGKFKPPGGQQQKHHRWRRDEDDPKRQSRGIVPHSHTNASDADVGGLDGVVAEYAPLVRLIVDHLAKAGGIDPKIGGRAVIGQSRMKWNERMPAPAKRLRTALAGGAAGGGWLERLRRRCMTAGCCCCRSLRIWCCRCVAVVVTFAAVVTIDDRSSTVNVLVMVILSCWLLLFRLLLRSL